ncbi:hypothetical protein VTO73DRAFT_12200 [Trametes versicolor]
MHSLPQRSLRSDFESQPTQTPANVAYGSHTLNGPLISPYYGYLPTEWTSVLFATLFLITAVLHLMQAGMYRKWWLFPTVVLACCGEVLGWACRVWSYHSPLKLTPYMVQTVVLVISPTFLIGALFITFGKMCAHLGQQYSRISPRLYARIFFTSDVVALLVQSAGGGIAASNRGPDVVRLGGHIILAGVTFQLASLSVFCILVAEYVARWLRGQSIGRNAASNDSVSDSATIYESPGRDIVFTKKPLVIAVCLETALLYIRAVYRTIELAGGWDGRVSRTQPFFVVFDGTTVLLATLLFNFYHPGRIMKSDSELATKDEDPKSRGPV